MKIVYSSLAAKKILRLPASERKKVLRRVHQLGSGQTAGKKLKRKLDGLLSFRAWPYRIIYQAKNKTLFVVTVEHRQGVYK